MFDPMNSRHDHRITTLMRTRDLETVLANSTWVPEAVSNAARVKIEMINAQIETLNAANRGM